MEVAYHPGYCYAAYKSEDINQVIIHSFDLHKSYVQNLKVSSITLFATRPLSLVYHSNEFHVFDIQVCNFCHKHMIAKMLFSAVCGVFMPRNFIWNS